jgi:hypothetical protein
VQDPSKGRAFNVSLLVVEIATRLRGVAFGRTGLIKPDICPLGCWSAVSQDPNISSYSCSMKRNGWEMAHTFPVTTDFSSKNVVSTFARLQTGYSDAGCEWATQIPAEGAEISLVTSLLDCSS